MARRLRSGILYGPAGRRSALPLPGAAYHHWLRHSGVGVDSAILDVGCGAGKLLHKLRNDGFRDLHGVDPYLPAEVHEPGLRIVRRQVSEMDGAYDLVMLHHSLEHIPDQVQALREAARLARPTGTVLVRIPVADSWAWRHYGVDWVQLDALRHLYLHTRRSLETVAAAAGLRLARVLHDSEPLQFWGSELYRRDIPLLEPATLKPPRISVTSPPPRSGSTRPARARSTPPARATRPVLPPAVVRARRVTPSRPLQRPLPPRVHVGRGPLRPSSA